MWISVLVVLALVSTQQVCNAQTTTSLTVTWDPSCSVTPSPCGPYSQLFLQIGMTQDVFYAYDPNPVLTTAGLQTYTFTGLQYGTTYLAVVQNGGRGTQATPQQQQWVSTPPYQGIPPSFDTRQQWPNCGTTILNQGGCGSCYLIATTSTLSDRLCITQASVPAGSSSSSSSTSSGDGDGSSSSSTTTGDGDGGSSTPSSPTSTSTTTTQISPNLIVSPQSTLDCTNEGQSRGCMGGIPCIVLNEFMSTSITTCGASCCSGNAPYTAGYVNSNGGQTTPPMCGQIGQTTCAESSCQASSCVATSSNSVPSSTGCQIFNMFTRTELPVHNGYIGPTEQVQDALAIQQEIMQNGPVTAAMNAQGEFALWYQQNPTGVYQGANNTVATNHAVKIIGWGTSSIDNIPYWIIANQWSTEWANGGFFYLPRGFNYLGIESNVMFPLVGSQQPAVSGNTVQCPTIGVSAGGLISATGQWLAEQSNSPKAQQLFNHALSLVHQSSSSKGVLTVRNNSIEVSTQVVNGFHHNVSFITEENTKGESIATRHVVFLHVSATTGKTVESMTKISSAPLDDNNNNKMAAWVIAVIAVAVAVGAAIGVAVAVTVMRRHRRGNAGVGDVVETGSEGDSVELHTREAV